MVKSLNRAALIAILPLMAFAISAMTKGTGGGAAVAPHEGVLVVANLRDDSLSFLDFAAGSTRTLLLTGAPHELVAVDGRIYATVPHRDLLVEVDPAAPGVLRSVSLPGQPHGLAAQGDDLFVALDEASSLVHLGRVPLTEYAREPAGNTPHAVAAEGSSVFVAVARENSLALSGTGRTAETGPLPESVAIAGRYVVTADAGGSLSVFDKASLEFIGRMHLEGGPTRVVTVAGETVAVSLNESGQVAIVDLARWRVVRKIVTFPRPDGLCLSPEGSYLAVVSNATDTVQVFATASWRRAAMYATGRGPGSCVWLSGKMTLPR